MVEREHGPSPDTPGRDDALAARIAAHLADLPPADDLTRRRHLQTALAAYDELHGSSAAPPAPTTRIGRMVTDRRPQRILGAVAAATVLMIGLGVVASIGQPAPELDLMRSATPAEGVTAPEGENPPVAAATDTASTTLMLVPEPAPAATSSTAPAAASGTAPVTASDAAPAAGSDTAGISLAEAAGACRELVEEDLDRQARAAGMTRDPSGAVIVTPVDNGGGSSTEVVRIVDALGGEVLLDRRSCTLLEP